jgi:hypothetical protein
MGIGLVLPLTFGCGNPTDPPTPSPELNQGHPPSNAPPANVVGGFAIEVPALTLTPGEESFPCWVFPMELEGPSRLVGGAKLTTGPGMHHGNITSRPARGEGVRSCGEDETDFGSEALDIAEGGAVLFGSSTQVEGEEWQSFPDGMGYPIADGYEIVARMHYLNPTTEPVTVAPRYEWFTVDEAKVTHVLGPFIWVLKGWEIAPLSDKTVSADCYPPAPMNVVNALPHMHALGTEFFGSYLGGPHDGLRWLDSPGYDPEGGVLRQYTPAIDLSIADGSAFGCSWENHFDKTIVEGVGDNEMCMLFGYAYPYEHSYSAVATEDSCLMIAPGEPGG